MITLCAFLAPKVMSWQSLSTPLCAKTHRLNSQVHLYSCRLVGYGPITTKVCAEPFYNTHASVFLKDFLCVFWLEMRCHNAPSHSRIAPARQARLISLECENAKLHAKLISAQMRSAASHNSTTSSTSSENSYYFSSVAGPDHKSANREGSSSSSSVAGSMGSTSASRVYMEENSAAGVTGSAERVLELQASLRAEQAASLMHQKRIQELERRLRFHNQPHAGRSSNAEAATGQHTISDLKEERSQYREGLRQVATILDDGAGLNHSDDSEVHLGKHDCLSHDTVDLLSLPAISRSFLSECNCGRKRDYACLIADGAFGAFPSPNGGAVCQSIGGKAWRPEVPAPMCLDTSSRVRPEIGNRGCVRLSS